MNVISEFSKRFSEGGIFFMSLILVCLLLSMMLLVFGFMNYKTKINKSRKMMNLSSEISVLGLIIGFLASTIGLIGAFDTIESIESINHLRFATGLKVSFLTIVFGCVTFIVPRTGIIILKALLTPEEEIIESKP